MAEVAVRGTSRRAAEWATRYLAAGHDVWVDGPAVATTVAALWPEADRLGLFPGAGLARLQVGAPAAPQVVHVIDGPAPQGWAGGALHISDAVARGCSPIHLLPLVEVSGPDAAALTALYRSMGMTPVAADGPAAERHALGPALVDLVGNDADALIAVMRALRPSGIGAGEAVARLETLRLAAGATRPWQPGDPPAAPLRLYRTPVEPEWVDYNGHMTESAYLTAAGWASDALFRYIGDDEAYRAAGHSFYTVETHIHYVREVAVHEPIEFTTHVLGVDAKRVHLVHEMYHGADQGLLCTVEQMLLHVDMQAGRSAAILPHVAAALQAIAHAHAALPVPPQVGSVMRLPPPKP